MGSPTLHNECEGSNLKLTKRHCLNNVQTFNVHVQLQPSTSTLIDGESFDVVHFYLFKGQCNDNEAPQDCKVCIQTFYLTSHL